MFVYIYIYILWQHSVTVDYTTVIFCIDIINFHFHMINMSKKYTRKYLDKSRDVAAMHSGRCYGTSVETEIDERI